MRARRKSKMKTDSRLMWIKRPSKYGCVVLKGGVSSGWSRDSQFDIVILRVKEIAATAVWNTGLAPSKGNGQRFIFDRIRLPQIPGILTPPKPRKVGVILHLAIDFPSGVGRPPLQGCGIRRDTLGNDARRKVTPARRATGATIDGRYSVEFLLLAAIFLTSTGFLVHASISPDPTEVIAPAPAAGSSDSGTAVPQLGREYGGTKTPPLQRDP